MIDKYVNRLIQLADRHVIVVLPDPCVDDISGERFPAAVLIEVDGRRLRGCGAPIAP